MLLFFIVWKLLCVDDLAILAESLEDAKNRLSIRKLKIAEKDLKVNVSMTKILSSGKGMNAKESGTFPCSICLKDAVNSVHCSSCKHWIHMRSSKLNNPLASNESLQFVFQWIVPAIANSHSIEVVDSFCYFGDMITTGGGCAEATTVRCRNTLEVLFFELVSVGLLGKKIC